MIDSYAFIAERVTTVRFFISLDMEGVAGLVNWAGFDPPTGPDHAFAIRQATAEVLAVIEGLRDGAREAGEPVEGFTVADAHARGLNLPPDGMPRDVTLVRGFPRPNYMVEGLGPEHALACFIGYHSRVGFSDALMDHSYSGGAIYEIRLDGKVVGETELNAAYAANFGVPLGLVSGDAALEAQVTESFGPAVVFVRTKAGIGRFAAACEHPANILEQLREGARRAVLSQKDLPLYRAAEPCTLEVGLTETQMADLLELYPCFERTGGRSIRITAPEMPVLYRAYMGLLLVAGVAKKLREG